MAQRSGADPTATGRENLMLQGRLYGLRGRAVGTRADELLGHFGLTEAAGRLVKTYSGGMQRRLDVALGLMHQPAVALPAGADAALVRSVLAGLPEVREVVIAGRDVSARSDDGAVAVPVVLAQLQRAGINAASVAVARPSLDDVYLRHTGRRYHEVQAPEFGTPDGTSDETARDMVEASK